MRCAISFLIVVFILAFPLSSLSETICIYQQEERRCSNCAFLISVEEFNQTFIGNDSILKFCSNINLNTVLHIEGKSNISIIGYDSLVISSSAMEMAGLYLEQVSNLNLYQLHFNGCSFEYNMIRAAIVIIDSYHVIISEVNVFEASGIGMVLLNTFGKVYILHSRFEYNSGNYSVEKMAGGGLYIENNKCNGNHTWFSMYKISHCIFHYNIISFNLRMVPIFNYNSEKPFSTFGGGGGLNIIMFNSAKNNTFIISNCVFMSNSALNGGGLYVGFRDASSANSLKVLNTNFTLNEAREKGGGGVEVGFVPSHSPISETHDWFPEQNSAVFMNCHFQDNTAYFGGGTSIYATQDNTYQSHGNSIYFMKCSWTNNMATTGAAVDLASHIWNRGNGLLPQLSFTDCTFYENYIKDRVTSEGEMHKSLRKGEGAFFSVGFVVHFSGMTEFSGNNGTSMYLISSTVQFCNNSTTIFLNNVGFSGGAIGLLGYSALNLEDNSVIKFVSNCAEDKGGAIFVENLNQKDAFSTYTCFFQYVGNHSNVSRRNSFVTFSGNRAGECQEANSSGHHSGQALFAMTLKSCHNRCQRIAQQKIPNIDEKVFSCIGNFTFENYNQTADIATSGNKIIINESELLPFKVIPGRYVELPITMLDDLEHEILDVIHIYIINKIGSNIIIHSSDDYNHGKMTMIFGMPGNKATVHVDTVNNREIGIKFEVEMQECPPGYVIRTSGGGLSSCKCSASTSNNKIRGIHRCEDNISVALLGRGYFFGYMKSSGSVFGKEKDQFSSYCPPRYCKTNRPNKEKFREYLLINTTSISELDQRICGPYRTGIVCGLCTKNHSIFYHSTKYHCDDNSHCHLGWIYYILSEILPVTLFFVIIIMFDIKFTSGALNGFVFFAQVVDTIMISANGFIVLSDELYHLLRAGRFFLRAFSLNFFSLRELSYCLWDTDNPLDMIIFKYVTILYALLLVFVIILSLKFCSCSKLEKIHVRKLATPQNTIIHGLSGFLVICYSECVRVSLLILTPISLNSPFKNMSFPLVVFYNGEMQYLVGKHLLYAVPAAFFFIIFGIIPPILLIAYPLCYKLFALCHINETRAVSILCRIIPLEMIKPLFDAFQSSFKDQYRFFSGLYFIYRLSILSSFVLLHNLTEFYLMIQLQLVIILGVHTIVQPYKKVWHNVLDGFMFMILASINAMTVFNYKHATERVDYQSKINSVSAFQILMVFIPIVYITVYFFIKLWLRLKVVVKEKTKKRDSADGRIVLPKISSINPLDQTDDAILSDEYHYRHLSDDGLGLN